METTMTPDTRATRSNHGRILAGIAVMLAGLAMLADRTGLGGLHLSGRYWPLILIVLGVLKISDRTRGDGARRPLRSGLWLVYVGLWALVSEFHLFGFDYSNSWPLLVIGAGVSIVWRAFDSPAGRCGSVREH
jgi:cell wall-active antibiotic response 4TMS protein YvqF